MWVLMGRERKRKMKENENEWKYVGEIKRGRILCGIW
jgi:hypothetical protein